MKKTVTLIIALAIPFLLYSQDNIFTGPGTDWDTPANWSTGKVPSTDITQMITIASDCIVSNLNSVNYTFMDGSTFKIESGVSFTNNGSGIWTMGGLIGNQGTFIGDLVIAGNIEPGVNPSNWSCGDDLVFGGQTYSTLQIGGQCWMAENLNVGVMIIGSSNQTNNGTVEKYCYDNNLANCAIYGGLYQWDEMMHYTTTEGTQGVCPTGWHLPTDLEWTTMADYVGDQPEFQCNNSQIIIGKSLASTTGWEISLDECNIGNNQSSNNATGFASMPAGVRLVTPLGGFTPMSIHAMFWSSTEQGTTFAWRRTLVYSSSGLARSSFGKQNGKSVRCIQD